MSLSVGHDGRVTSRVKYMGCWHLLWKKRLRGTHGGPDVKNTSSVCDWTKEWFLYYWMWNPHQYSLEVDKSFYGDDNTYNLFHHILNGNWNRTSLVNVVESVVSVSPVVVEWQVCNNKCYINGIWKRNSWFCFRHVSDYIGHHGPNYIDLTEQPNGTGI